MALTSTVAVNISAGSTLALDLATRTVNLVKTPTVELANGTGLGQADVIFSDTRSTAATDSLDMIGGSLLDNLGNVWAPARIKGIIVVAASANTGNVLLRRPAAATGVPFLSTAGDEVPIHPGGIFVLMAPSAAGYVVTATTGDIIEVAAGAGTVTYDIYIFGATA